MPSTTVTLELHVLWRDVTGGWWCERCLLPSAVRVPFLFADAHTLRVVGRGVVVTCLDCGHQHTG